MKLKSLRSEEDGLVSIIVTMIIMSVLTLIAIGFSNLAAREQRQSLDQQLNTQAFYAAESGINEAIHNPGGFLTDGTCNKIDGDDASVKSTCILVDPKPQLLEYSEISTDGSTVIPIQSDSNISSITISWQEKGESDRFAVNNNHQLLKQTDWLNWELGYSLGPPLVDPDLRIRTGLLRVMLMPNNFADRADLINKTQTYLLYPSDVANSTAGAGVISGSYEGKGAYIDGYCSDTKVPKFCSATINISIPAGTMYLLRLRAIYAPSSVSICATTGGVCNARFNGAQTEIDSTGRTTDVLRRLKVKVPAPGNKWTARPYPEFAVETTDTLCKRLRVGPGHGGILGFVDSDVTDTADPDFSACAPTP